LASIFGATLTRFIAFGAEDIAVAFGNFFIVLVEEIDMIDLLIGKARKFGLMPDQVFQIGFGRNHIITQHWLVPESETRGIMLARPI
jgi:hypothetical protein